MEPDYSDEEMNSKEKEISDVLLLISEFNVSEINIAIDNVTQYDECSNMSESLDNLISEICEVNIKNSDYLIKKALIIGLALKCSKKLNKIIFRDMQQHIKSKEDEVHILKERLVALEKLVTTNSEKLVTTNTEIQKTATSKINKIKKTKISPQKTQGKKKSKTDDKFALQTPVELTNKFSALDVEEKTETLEIEEFPEIQNEKVISPTNENREETDEPTLVEKKQKRVPPIMIDESLNTPALLDEISAINFNFYQSLCKFLYNGTVFESEFYYASRLEQTSNETFDHDQFATVNKQ
ncbi:hypothetical protein NPIL_569341 [Nephila pilipes]|uniref:Uncharacterized protein n=1 Tax=Nephila pilipes TaxID=299642 RepID=A0A8X6TPT9_NEPPI|nr:hypothetical protein NPIL_569341 [Nephila pilipes]